MRELPHAYELLEYAREILRTELIPTLPSEQRLNGLMIANAMAIAARQLRNGDSAHYQELHDLQQLCHDLKLTDNAPKVEILTTTALEQQLLELNKTLASAIRQRKLGDKPADVFAHLQRSTAIKVAESSGK